MKGILTPLHLIITATAGWLNRYQANVIDYLIEQNRVLLELHGSGSAVERWSRKCENGRRLLVATIRWT